MKDAAQMEAGEGGIPVSDPLDDFFVSGDERDSMLQSFAEDATRRGQEEMLELLAFWVADEQYAIDINTIQEIIKVPEITPVPRVPPSVLGIVSLRGTIVPVLDLRRVLSLECLDLTRGARVLVLRSSGELVGLLVDRVTSVVRFHQDGLEATPRVMQNVGEMLRGVGRMGDDMLIVLDGDAVTSVLDDLT